MRVDLFDFDLPQDRIALRPVRPRDAARMLLVDGDQLSDRGVLDLPDILRPGDVLIFNDTRVIPAHLEGRRGEARIGATLHRGRGHREGWAFARKPRGRKIEVVIEVDTEEQ
ncbi:MAG: S-adenosylmethionine:tRNA ribosyltransferase-isomerase, partial [Sphingomonas sp.]|nr:S-adenosylmethionine:tRNA ribosyltransferase-isomerase [Sphingomonas sp.]